MDGDKFNKVINQFIDLKLSNKPIDKILFFHLGIYYARELYDVPEFIGFLATILRNRTIGTEYFQNSKYYCLEYLVPIEKVYFYNA